MSGSLKKYRILKTIGTGTSATVKLAEMYGSREKVAIKMIEKKRIADERDALRLNQEIKLLTLLHHPNIASMREEFATERHIYIVLEYCAGGELFDYVVARDYIKEPQARLFFRQLLSAVSYCHANFIAHRDVKPENILLDQDLNIKIVDFGLAKCFRDDANLQTNCGSPGYCPPEILNSASYDGRKADVWSLGVVLYVIVCGMLPFDGDDVKSIFARVRSGIYQCPPRLSRELKDLLGRMLLLEPARRAPVHELLRHPWVLLDSDGPPNTHLPSREPVSTADDAIVGEAAAFGFSAADVRAAVAAPEASPASCIYHLLLEKRVRLSTAPSDAPARPAFIKAHSLGDVKSARTGVKKRGASVLARPSQLSALAVSVPCMAILDTPSSSSVSSPAVSSPRTPQSALPELPGPPLALPCSPPELTCAPSTDSPRPPAHDSPRLSTTDSPRAAGTDSPRAVAADSPRRYRTASPRFGQGVLPSSPPVIAALPPLTSVASPRPQTSRSIASERRSSFTTERCRSPLADGPATAAASTSNERRSSPGSVKSRLASPAAPVAVPVADGERKSSLSAAVRGPSSAPNTPSDAAAAGVSTLPSLPQRPATPRATVGGAGDAAAVAGAVSIPKRRLKRSSKRRSSSVGPGSLPHHSPSDGPKSPMLVREIKSSAFAQTSGKEPEALAVEMERVLRQHALPFERDGFVFDIRQPATAEGHAAVSCSAEICKVAGLPMFGFKWRRVTGDTWDYKRTCRSIQHDLVL